MKKCIVILLCLICLGCISTKRDQLVLDVTATIVHEYDQTAEVLIGTKTKPGLLDLLIKKNPTDEYLKQLKQERTDSAIKVAKLTAKLKEMILASGFSEEEQMLWFTILDKYLEKAKEFWE